MLGWFPKRNSHIFLGQISRTSRSNAGPLPKTSRIDCLEGFVRASGYMSLSDEKQTCCRSGIVRFSDDLTNITSPLQFPIDRSALNKPNRAVPKASRSSPAGVGGETPRNSNSRTGARADALEKISTCWPGVGIAPLEFRSCTSRTNFRHCLLCHIFTGLQVSALWKHMNRRMLGRS